MPGKVNKENSSTTSTHLNNCQHDETDKQQEHDDKASQTRNVPALALQL